MLQYLMMLALVAREVKAVAEVVVAVAVAVEAEEVEDSRRRVLSCGVMSILEGLKTKVVVDHAGHLEPQHQSKAHLLGRESLPQAMHLRISHSLTR